MNIVFISGLLDATPIICSCTLSHESILAMFLLVSTLYEEADPLHGKALPCTLMIKVSFGFKSKAERDLPVPLSPTMPTNVAIVIV